MSGHIEVDHLLEHQPEREAHGEPATAWSPRGSPARSKRPGRTGRLLRGTGHLRLAGLCLVAVFAVGMAVSAGTASAAKQVWEQCSEGGSVTKYTEHQCKAASSTGKWEWNEIAGTEEVRLKGTLRFKDTKVPILGTAEVECNGESAGVVGPGKLGKITEVKITATHCKGIKVCEEVKSFEARDLPWQTELYETESKQFNKLIGDGKGEPGWKFECKTSIGTQTDECLTESEKPESLLLENKLTNGELLVLATFQHLRKAKCSQGGAESGEITGSIGILKTNGTGLRTGSGGGVAATPTSLTTTLAGEGKEGETITVQEGSKVKDKATLSGTNASTATGTVTYRVYSDSKCEHEVAKAGEVTVTSGSVPASNEEELEGGKAYYWQASYSGDSKNEASTSACGSEISSVKAKTSLSTILSGEGKEGTEIEVLEGVKVTDQATLTGANSSSAGGKAVYKVYSDSKCEKLATEAGEETVSSGAVPASSEEELSAGSYYWQVTYKGDSLHQESTSSCGEISKIAATSWSLEEPPAPTGAKESDLFGVSCASSTKCIAAGLFKNSSDVGVPLAEGWSGTTWSSQEPPTPAGTEVSALKEVSCASSTECIAVGYFVTSSAITMPLAEKWNGTTWSSQEPPAPAGNKESYLNGVSCASSTKCMAVGSFVNSSDTEVPLAEKWNGTTWSSQEPPAPTGAKQSLLYYVSCASSTECVAVGLFVNSSDAVVPLAEKWNGTTWSSQEPPVPTGATYSNLIGVSCTSSTECVAVGYFYNSSATYVPLAEKWNGTTWSVQEPSVPAGAKESFLDDVSCTSSTECVAVGSFVNSSGREVPLAEKRNGTTWSVQEPPAPAGSKELHLNGVSCRSSTECMAVGGYLNSSNTYVPLAERMS